MKKYLIVYLMVMVAMLLLMIPGAMAEAVDPAPAAQPVDLTPIFQAFIAFLASLVTLKLIPWINARTTAQQQSKMRSAVKVAVFAAEQLYGAGNGKEKLLYAKGKLAEKGYKVDIDEIEAQVRMLAIEGADLHWLPATDPIE